MLIAIVFIAELIIAFQLIALIMKVDKKICDLNACIKAFNPLAETGMQYVRYLTVSFSDNVKKCIDFVKKQQEKIVVRTVTTLALYGILLLFRLKRIKLKRIGNLAVAIHDIMLDLAV